MGTGLPLQADLLKSKAESLQAVRSVPRCEGQLQVWCSTSPAVEYNRERMFTKEVFQTAPTRPKPRAGRPQKARVHARHTRPQIAASNAARRSATPLHTILFLAANPSGTDRWALDREARAIQVELERSGYRDCFRFETRWAAEALDLLRELRRLKPTVVHFSGHCGRIDVDTGSATALHTVVASVPDVDPTELRHGVFFQGGDGCPQFVPIEALEDVFDAAGASVRVVVLNGCYSGTQAEALVTHVDCVVGMGGAVREAAARNFAIGFYGALGECESVATAYKQGRAAISLERLRGADAPQLKIRKGVDAGRLVLAMLPDGRTS
jgi:hypothetical protein